MKGEYLTWNWMPGKWYCTVANPQQICLVLFLLCKDSHSKEFLFHGNVTEIVAKEWLSMWWMPYKFLFGNTLLRKAKKGNFQMNHLSYHGYKIDSNETNHLWHLWFLVLVWFLFAGFWQLPPKWLFLLFGALAEDKLVLS